MDFEKELALLTKKANNLKKVANAEASKRLEQLDQSIESTKTALKKDLERSRQLGYALDDEEHAVGLRCVAGVVRDETGTPIAALSLSGPAARIPNDRIEQFGLKIRRVCADLSREYGGMPV